MKELYTLNFDFLNAILLLVPFIIGIGFMSFFKWNKPNYNSKHKYDMYLFNATVCMIIGFIVICMGIYFTYGYISSYNTLKKMLDNNKAYTTYGEVSKFHPENKEGHDSEYFYVDKVYFEYSHEEIANGYHKSKYRGGVIKENGQKLKIYYVPTSDDYEGNIILKIEEKTK